MRKRNSSRFYRRPLLPFDGLSDSEREAFSRTIKQLNTIGSPEQVIDKARVSEIRYQLALYADSTSLSHSGSLSRQMIWGVPACLCLLVLMSIWFLAPTTIVAPPGKISIVALQDGSTVELRPGTALSYRSRVLHWHNVVHLDGDAFFSFAKQRRPFLVKTKNSIIHVMGTRFSVANSGGLTRVYLYEGEVGVTSATDLEKLLLAPGEMAASTSSGNKRILPTHAFLPTWRTRQPLFNATSFKEVIIDLEELYAVNIYLPTGIDLEQHITYMAPKPVTLEVVLADICRVTGLSYRPVSDGFTLVNDV